MSLLLLFEDNSEESENGEGDTGFENDLNKDDRYHVHHAKVQTPTPFTINRHRHTQIVWNFVFLVMSLFFLAAAYVQHNDPDPLLWMIAYLVPCLTNFSIIISSRPTMSKSGLAKFWRILNWIITVHNGYCYTIGFWTLAHYIHRQIFKDEERLWTKMFAEEHMMMEEAKELLGLCLVIAWLSFLKNEGYLKLGKKGVIFGIVITGLPIVSWIIVEKVEESRENEKCL